MKKLKTKAILEVLGRPKEHVDKTLDLIKEKLSKEEKNFELNKTEIFPSEQIKDQENLFSGFIEADISFKNLDLLVGFCFDYMPSSVEVTDPEKEDMTNSDINNMLNDLLAKMHQYDMAMKNMYAENILLKKKVEELEGKPKESKK